jgi:hypothetical protein
MSSKTCWSMKGGKGWSTVAKRVALDCQMKVESVARKQMSLIVPNWYRIERQWQRIKIYWHQVYRSDSVSWLSKSGKILIFSTMTARNSICYIDKLGRFDILEVRTTLPKPTKSKSWPDKVHQVSISPIFYE